MVTNLSRSCFDGRWMRGALVCDISLPPSPHDLVKCLQNKHGLIPFLGTCYVIHVILINPSCLRLMLRKNMLHKKINKTHEDGLCTSLITNTNPKINLCTTSIHLWASNVWQWYMVFVFGYVFGSRMPTYQLAWCIPMKLLYYSSCYKDHQCGISISYLLL
jgi:hypothetical protein